ncbi:hypothetical protein JTB14_028606, partial [Gonioctena quinquepunctata]
NNSWIF